MNAHRSRYLLVAATLATLPASQAHAWWGPLGGEHGGAPWSMFNDIFGDVDFNFSSRGWGQGYGYPYYGEGYGYPGYHGGPWYHPGFGPPGGYFGAPYGPPAQQPEAAPPQD